MKNFKSAIWGILIVLAIGIGIGYTGSAILYTLATPTTSDHIMGFDDPAGDWTMVRFAISDILALHTDESDPHTQYLKESDLESTPTDGETAKAPNSDVFYDLQQQVNALPTSDTNTQLFEGKTRTALDVSSDATPEVTAGGHYYLTGTTQTVTDFVDTDGNHTDFSNNDILMVEASDADVTLSFSGSYLKREGGGNYTGAATNYPLIVFQFDSNLDAWVALNLSPGMTSPTSLQVDIDWALIAQLAKNPRSSAPTSPYNGQIECADGDNWQPGSTDQGTDVWIVQWCAACDGGSGQWLGRYNVTDGKDIVRENVYFCVACSDEDTDLTTGTAKRTFRMPYAMTLSEIRASVNTAPVGSTIIVDVNEGGATIMSATKLSIDASEKTSTTAATAAVISDSALADDGEITVDVDQIGNSTAGKGLKVCFGGTRP